MFISRIAIVGLTFAYPGSYDNIFEQVSLTLDSEWKLGLIGRNGRGKTTLLKLLMGQYEYRGSISAEVAFQYFPFPVPDQELDAMAVILGIVPDCPEWRVRRELGLLGMDEELLYRPWATLSNGERTRLQLAALFLRDNAFPLIDEPTNHLDQEARERVGEYLAGKQGFILVSHDRRLLDRAIDHVLSINKATIEVQQGNFSTWWENKCREDQYELAQHEKLTQDIKRLDQAARRSSSWSVQVEKSKIGQRNSGSKPDRGYIGAKAAKMMQRAKNDQRRKEAALTEKAGLLHNIERREFLELRPAPYHSRRLLEAAELSLYYGGREIVRELSFTLERGQRLNLAGRNGSGKSSLLKLIAGEDIRHGGWLKPGGGLIISYVPQDASFLRGDMRDYARSAGADETLFKSFLRKLDFPRLQFDKDLAELSEGQKKKVLLARSLAENAHLYIWDEPLNYIDVISRLQIEELLLAACPTLIFVEHDRAFCEKIATRTLTLP